MRSTGFGLLLLATLLPATAASLPAPPPEPASPFVKGQAGSPVDWMAWGPEAVEAARKRNVPIFLFVGTATDGFSKSMLRDSFANPELAGRFNQSFVNAIADAHESAGLAHALDTYLRLAKRVEGPPYTFWLTPDLDPIEAGAYFPPAEEWGKPGIVNILDRVEKRWQADPDAVQRQARREFANLLPDLAAGGAWADEPRALPDLVAEAIAFYESEADPNHGGFGFAPKDLHPGRLVLLATVAGSAAFPPAIRSQASDLLASATAAIARGGVIDWISGGVFDGAADDTWTLPHFSKSLALQAATTEAARATFVAIEQPEALLMALNGAHYALRVTAGLGLDTGLPPIALSDPADGEEHPSGRYFLFTESEAADLIADPDLRESLSLTAAGTFSEEVDPTASYTGLRLPRPALDAGSPLPPWLEQTAAARSRLDSARRLRPPPETDNGISLFEHAMMATAVARVAELTGQPGHRQQALVLASGIARSLQPDGTLPAHRYRAGEQSSDAAPTARDCLAWMAMEMARFLASETTFPRERLAAAADSLVDRFFDEDGRLVRETESAPLPGWPRIAAFPESALPSAQALAVETFHLLDQLDPAGDHRKSVDALRRGTPKSIALAPQDYPWLLTALIRTSPGK